MPILDNNPERRNLFVTSSAFVIYFLGEGRLSDNVLSIQAISITFDKPIVIAVLAWVMLFWFFLRYRQLCSGELNKAIFEEVNSEISNLTLVEYLKSKTKMPYKDENGFTIKQIIPKRRKWSVQISIIKGGKRSDGGIWVEYQSIDSETFNINWAWFGLVKLSILISLFFKEPGIGSWFIPQVLFYTACILGLINAFNN